MYEGCIVIIFTYNEFIETKSFYEPEGGENYDDRTERKRSGPC